MLVRSGQVLKCLPHAEGEITWIPVDAAASAVIEMRASKEPFLNLIHPQTRPSPTHFFRLCQCPGRSTCKLW